MSVGLFVVHHNPSRTDDMSFLFVKDGFDWLAFLFPPVWALFHRLWLVLVAMVVFALLLFFAAEWFLLPVLLIYLPACGWLAFAAGSVRGFFLSRRGWREAGLVLAPDLQGAEQRFFGGAGGPAPSVFFLPA